MASKAGAMAWGFSCQPFSKLGDQQHGGDPRSQTLPYGLYASYLLQKDLNIIECVPQAATSPFVQQCLAYHMAMTRAEKSETLLELGQLWPSARRRWWCVLMHESFPKINFRDFPTMMQKPTIQQLLPDWIPLTPDELTQLSLTQQELSAFTSHKPGLEKQIVNSCEALSTALHSWGNQCQPCKCGCRAAFSDARLTEHGIYGALIQFTTNEGLTAYRHISPKEMALLCGFPKAEGWHADQRLLMAGIGQLASPIQSAWVFGHIRELLQSYQFGSFQPVHPRQIVACVCMDVFKLRDQWFPSTIPTVAMSLFQEGIEQLLEPPKAQDSQDTTCPANSQEKSTEAVQSDFEGSKAESVQIHTHLPLDPLDQAILAHVEEQPQTVERPMKKRKEIPGAVIGFRLEDRQESKVESSGKSHVLDRWCTTHEETAVAPTVLPTASNESIESLPIPPAQPSPAPQAVQTFGSAVTPDDLHSTKVLVWDRQQMTIMPIAIGANSTGRDLLQATHALECGKGMALYDVFGSTLDLTAPLEEGQIVGISGPNDKSNDDLPFHQAEQILSTLPRWFSLLVQGTRVAQDEMIHYLTAISSQFGVAMVPPILLDTWEDSQIQEWSLALRQAPVSISTILVGGHWIPVVVSNQDGFHAISTEQGLSLSSNLMPDAVGVEGPMMEQIFPNDCGFQSIAWLIAVVSHQSTVSSFTYAQSCQWRQLFWHHVYINPSSRSALPVVLGGHEDDLMVAITTLLKEHGVGAEQLQDRAQAIVKKLGAEPINNALQSSRPWQTLKRIANEAKPPFRLVAPDELDRILAEKAKAGKPIGNRATKAPRSGSTSQVSIGPNDVIIPKGVFAQDDGSLMPQLQLRQVGTAAKGIIVVTEQEVQPYLASHNISNDGLAFIVLHPSTAIQTTPGQLIRFPAQCATTGEPILVSAFMIQKGKQAVQRALPTKLPKVEEVPVSTIKMLVFRDQLPMGWKEFCEAPVKNLISIAKCLQICRANGCDCEL